jgi:RNase P subunit RPR2
VSPEVGITPGLELVLRLVAAEAETMSCRGCEEPLSNPAITLREHDLQHVVVEVRCRSCGDAFALRVEPEAEEGRAGVR